MGMIAVGGDGGSNGGADNLGIIELAVARIGASDEDAGSGVSGAPEPVPLTGLKIARVLAKHGGEDSTDEEVFDDAIGGVGAIAFAIANRALSVTGFAVLQLAKASESGVPDDLNRVEGALRDDLELLSGGKWRNLASIFERQEIGQSKKEAVF